MNELSEMNTSDDPLWRGVTMKSRERDCSQGFNSGTVVAIKVASVRAGLLPATRHASHSLCEWKTDSAHSASKLPRSEVKARSGDSSF